MPSAIPPITPLPVCPTTDNPNFDALADIFLPALVTFSQELDSFSDHLNTTELGIFDATRIADNIFEVSSKYPIYFLIVGSRVALNCGVDGTRYSSIVSLFDNTPITIPEEPTEEYLMRVTLSDNVVTTNIENVTFYLGSSDLVANHKTIHATGGRDALSAVDVGAVSLSVNSVVADSIKTFWGTGSDLSLYHDGTNSIIDNKTGVFYIRQYDVPSAIWIAYYNGTTTEPMIVATPNGAVQLYYDNAVKLATSNTGVAVTGTLAATTVTGANVTTGVDPGHTHTTTASKWTALTATTNFATTAPSTSTITMNTDLTATIKPGMAIKFTLSGTVYYAIVTAMTSNLMTIAGAPLTTTASALTALSYSAHPQMTEVINVIIPGYWADAADTSVIANDLLTKLVWRGGPAKLVYFAARARTTDSSGSTFPRVNIRIGATTTDYISTSNSNAGLAIAAADTWYNTIVDIATAKYSATFGSALEITTDANGGNDDSSDLTVMMVFVYE